MIKLLFLDMLTEVVDMLIEVVDMAISIEEVLTCQLVDILINLTC